MYLWFRIRSFMFVGHARDASSAMFQDGREVVIHVMELSDFQLHMTVVAVRAGVGKINLSLDSLTAVYYSCIKVRVNAIYSQT